VDGHGHAGDRRRGRGATGRLDPRLFDVTGLLETGYADTETDRVGLIVRYADGATWRPARVKAGEVIVDNPAGGAGLAADRGRRLGGEPLCAAGHPGLPGDLSRHTVRGWQWVCVGRTG
jgi:hypothetical protein